MGIRPIEFARRPSLGWTPLLSIVAVIALLAVAAGNIGGRIDAPWAEVAFFVGLALLVVPFGVRLLMASPERTERVALVVILGMALFACKYLRDPLWWGGYDEFLHVRTANDIILTGGLFAPNTLLGVSPYYPGLELVGTALSEVGNMTLFDSAAISLAAARLVFVLALFLFYEMATGSSRVAGLASLLYMTNPRFLYFNAQFAYESMALALAAVVLFLLARRGPSAATSWLGLSVITVVTIAAVVTTHHVTSAMLALFVLVWGAASVVVGRRQPYSSKPGRMGVLTVVMITGWTLLVATATIGYLGPTISSSLTELIRLTGGELETREIFVSRAGEVAPLWERVMGSASAAILLFILPLGFYIVWRTFRHRSALVGLAVAASVYPITLVGRLTRVGSEVASRTPEFLFIAMAPIVALVLLRFAHQAQRRVPWAAVPLLAILTLGGVIVGTPEWARVPGPYLVSADTRSVEPEGLAAADWARQELGPGNTMVADRVNRFLMSSLGLQNLITTYETGLAVRRLYLSPEIGPPQREIVRLGGIVYLVADKRLTTALPVVGHYFDRGEEFVVGQRQTPLDPLVLSKFDHSPAISRIFDSGNIQIYDVSGLADEP